MDQRILPVATLTAASGEVHSRWAPVQVGSGHMSGGMLTPKQDQLVAVSVYTERR